MFSTPLGAAFCELIESLAKADPERLEEILRDTSLELPAAIASHQKALGQMLVQLEDQGFGTPEQIGWLMIALAEITSSWHCHS